MWMRIKMAIMRFMQGRNGMDQLANHALWVLSRNISKRQAENSRYEHFLHNWRKELNQFIMRLKGTKEYKYFRCPSCKTRLRLRRGCGEKHITCPVCKNQFDQKA